MTKVLVLLVALGLGGMVVSVLDPEATEPTLGVAFASPCAVAAATFPQGSGLDCEAAVAHAAVVCGQADLDNDPELLAACLAASIAAEEACSDDDDDPPEGGGGDEGGGGGGNDPVPVCPVGSTAELIQGQIMCCYGVRTVWIGGQWVDYCDTTPP